MFSTDAIKYSLTGICHYACGLVHLLANIAEVDELRFFNQLQVQMSLPEYEREPKPYPVVQWLYRSGEPIKVYQLIYALPQQRAPRDYRDYIYHSSNYYLLEGIRSNYLPLSTMFPSLPALNIIRRKGYGICVKLCNPACSTPGRSLPYLFSLSKNLSVFLSAYEWLPLVLLQRYPMVRALMRTGA